MTCLHSLTNLYAKMTLFARRLSSPDKSRQNVATFFAKMHSHEMMTDIRTSVQLSYKHAKLLDFSSPPIEMQQIEQFTVGEIFSKIVQNGSKPVVVSAYWNDDLDLVQNPRKISIVLSLQIRLLGVQNHIRSNPILEQGEISSQPTPIFR